MVPHSLRAQEYRDRADAEARAGAATSLAQVRDKHERAARVWLDLAEVEDAREVVSAERRENPGLRAAIRHVQPV